MLLQRPLLAAKATDEELKRLPYPMLGSPKIDGIRALVASALLSRSMKPIRNTFAQRLFSRPEFYGLDGELVVGNPWDKNCMQQTSSGVMSAGGTPNVSYYVFDRWDRDDLPYETRLDLTHLTVTKWHLDNPDSGIKIHSLQHQVIEDYDHLLHVEKLLLEQGYEGVMLRLPRGKYKQNRSTLREAILVKVKRFEDHEAQVLEYEPLYRNENAQQRDERGYAKRSSSQDGLVPEELLGALWVQDRNSGVIFSIGSGFTLAQRQQLWDDRAGLVGKIIKYKSFSVGVKDKPRHPIFLGFRDRIDL